MIAFVSIFFFVKVLKMGKAFCCIMFAMVKWAEFSCTAHNVRKLGRCAIYSYLCSTYFLVVVSYLLF